MFRIAQISDTHLSAAKPFFVENFERTVESVVDAGVDMLVNTGDISLNGAEDDTDLVAAAELHRSISLPVRMIPGNHDIGDNADVPAHPGHESRSVDSPSRQRYVRRFGADWWCVDVPGWRLIGMNSLLLGSGLADARAQAAFLANATASAGARRIALFGHKPVCDRDLQEKTVGGRFLNPASRAELLGCLQGPVAVIACGHVHQYRDAMVGGTRHVWAPSTGFVLPDDLQPRYGVKRLGWVEHRFQPDGQYGCALVDVADTTLFEITDFPEAYGAFWESDTVRRTMAGAATAT